MRRSCQSMSVLNSSRAEFAQRRTNWTIGAVAEAARHLQRGAVRTFLHHFDRAAREDLLTLGGIVLLDVPGVEVARLVDIGPDLVAAPVKAFPTGALVVDAAERPIRSDLDTQEPVLDVAGAD